jgi:predicted esterase
LNRFYLVDVASAPAAERPVGATWMTREDRENEIADYVSYLDALWASIAGRLPARQPVRLTVLGFSQGTATAGRWVTLGASRPAHLVLWGGILPHDLPLLGANHPLRRTSLHFVIGSRDGFVTDERMAAEEARLRAADLSCDVVRYAGGHGIRRDVLVSIAQRLEEAARA